MNILGVGIAILAHLLNGSVSVIDKFLLSKSFKEPATYAFWIGVFGLGAFLLLPFNFELPQGSQWFLDLAGGATFVAALYFYYFALQQEEVSRVVPIVGSLIPIFTIVLAYFFLGEILTKRQIIAFVILIIAVIILTYRKSHTKINFQILLAAPLAALLFAASTVIMKKIFFEQSFFSGLAWSRLGGLPIALFFLLWREIRFEVFKKEEQPHGLRLLIFLGARFFSATGFVLVNLAISLASPSMVNALQGVQYAVLFFLAMLFTKFWPEILDEQFNRKALFAKIVGIACVVAGSIILAT